MSNLGPCSSLDMCPGVGLLDDMVVLFLVFKGTFTLFSIVAIPIYTPTNSVQGSFFLHNLNSTVISYFLIVDSNRGKVITHMILIYI